jgi:predicted Zn-dependent protease
MPDPIDELAQRWKRNPSAATTLALCDALRDHPRRPLVEQVGKVAEQRHAKDLDVQVSVARMYIESARLSSAQAVLVAAGKLAPRDARVYRWLGEVLLRRGDAERAEKVLRRAIQLGFREPEAELWLERARVFLPIQATAGQAAVAAEIANTGTGEPNGSAPDIVTESELEIVAESRLAAPSSRKRAGPPVVASDAAREPATILPRFPVPQVSKDRSPPPIPQAPGASSYPPGKDVMIPHPRDVLDALALSGIFESQQGVAAGWDRPSKGPKRKGTALLVTSMILFLGAGVATYGSYRQKRAEQHLQAEALLLGVEAQLHGGKPEELGDAEKKLGAALELESRNPRAALDWTRERAMVGLVKSGADVAFEDAMTRAKDVGVPEEKFAFARVASFLLQGDTAGAVGMLPRWDGPAAGDAWYQLVAGAALERAGDARARDRFTAAAKLDPELVVADVGLARASAFAGDPDEAMRLARGLRARLPDRAEPVALVALAWGRDPLRETTPAPAETEELVRRTDELPSGLKFVSHAIAALRALDRRSFDDARGEVQKGLAVADSPGAAVWLGTISLALGDEALARKAALSALQLSAVHEPARALAARVALATGRLDEALKATEDLDAAFADVVVVRAAAAYERVDPDGVARALEALRSDERKRPFVRPLSMAGTALDGKLSIDSAKRMGLANDDAPWSDLVLMDVALNAGDLATAAQIAGAWGKDSEQKPLRAIRLARLARHEGRLDAADSLSQLALDRGTVTPRVLWERAFELVARGKVAEVGPLLARYPLVLGPVATWLSAYANAASGAVEAAKGKTASLDPLSTGAPLEARIVVAAALGAMKDRKRGVEYTRDLLATGNLHPDLVQAALSLGFHKIDHGRRRPTYE